MKLQKDAMLPQPKIVDVSDPVVVGVDPVSDDTEPFMLRSEPTKRLPTMIKALTVDRKVARTMTPRAQRGKGVGLRRRSSNVAKVSSKWSFPREIEDTITIPSRLLRLSLTMSAAKNRSRRRFSHLQRR